MSTPEAGQTVFHRKDSDYPKEDLYFLSKGKVTPVYLEWKEWYDGAGFYEDDDYFIYQIDND